MTRLVTLDFETYYDQKTFSLSKMTTESYIRDPRFEVIGVGVKVDDHPTDWFSGTHDQIRDWLNILDWSNVNLLCHHTQWGLARVNSYIMKGKTYHTADKDLREDLFDNDFNNEELNHIVKNLEWEDIVEFYNDNELELEENTIETIDEKISAMSRIQRSMRFARSASRREVAKAIKLRRASDVKTLQNRAHKAARRALMNRFLRGRDKSQLSAQEKDQKQSLS